MNARTLAVHKSVAITHMSASERSPILLRTPAPPNRSMHTLRRRRIDRRAPRTNARSGLGGGGHLARVSASALPCPGLTPPGAPRRTDRKRHVRRCSNGPLRCTSTSTSAGGQREQRGRGGDGGAAGGICHLTTPNVPLPLPRAPKLQPAAAVRLLPCCVPTAQASARGARAPPGSRRRHEGAGAAREEGAQEGWGRSRPKRGAVEASRRAGGCHPRLPPT